MRFYIDFENVGNTGLVGIESLTENDCVRIYYSNNPNVDMHTVENITHSPAKIQFVKLPDSLKMMNLSNALDIVLLTDISRIAAALGLNYAIVISNDKGYDSVITELNQINQTSNILRLESIKSFSALKLANNVPTSTVLDYNAIDRLFTQTLSSYAQYKDKIVKIVKSSKPSCEINEKICKAFDSPQSKAIMSALKPFIKSLPGQ